MANEKTNIQTIEELLTNPAYYRTAVQNFVSPYLGSSISNSTYLSESKDGGRKTGMSDYDLLASLLTLPYYADDRRSNYASVLQAKLRNHPTIYIADDAKEIASRVAALTDAQISENYTSALGDVLKAHGLIPSSKSNDTLSQLFTKTKGLSELGDNVPALAIKPYEKDMRKLKDTEKLPELSPVPQEIVDLAVNPKVSTFAQSIKYSPKDGIYVVHFPWMRRQLFEDASGYAKFDLGSVPNADGTVDSPDAVSPGDVIIAYFYDTYGIDSGTSMRTLTYSQVVDLINDLDLFYSDFGTFSEKVKKFTNPLHRAKKLFDQLPDVEEGSARPEEHVESIKHLMQTISEALAAGKASESPLNDLMKSLNTDSDVDVIDTVEFFKNKYGASDDFIRLDDAQFEDYMKDINKLQTNPAEFIKQTKTVSASAIELSAARFNFFGEFDKGGTWALDKEKKNITRKVRSKSVDVADAVRQGGVWAYAQGDEVLLDIGDMQYTPAIIEARLPEQKYSVRTSAGNQLTVAEKSIVDAIELF